MFLFAVPSVLPAQQGFAARAYGGYGTTNGYGWGVGADVGYQFPMPILAPLPTFLGPFGAYFFGNEWFDEELGLQGEGQTAMYGAEIGTVWLQKPIYIRGNGAIGAARVGRAVDDGPMIWETNFLLTGGIIFGRQFGNWAVGLEPHFPIIIGSDVTSNAFILYLSVGYVAGPNPND